MCGHFGVAGFGINTLDLKIFRDLGIVSQLRGTDGAGVFQTRSMAHKTWDQSEFDKTGGNFIDLMYDADISKKSRLMQSMSVDVMMGHVRAATKGVINDANAHPFDFSNIVGAHNGTLRDKAYDHPTKTDSELLFRDINTRGMEVVLSELDRDSAFALVVYSHVDKHLYFVRNELRPLSFAFLKDRGVMYWASELKMLKYILRRHNEDAHYYTLSPSMIIRVKPSDITKTEIEKGPLGLLKVYSKLDRPFPTMIQKQMDEEARRKKEEEDKKAKAELDSTSIPVVAQQSPENNIIPFGKPEVKEPKKGQLVRSSQGEFLQGKVSKTCSCGGKNLSLLDQSLAKRGKHLRYTHNHVTDVFHCEDCGPVEEKANGTTQV